MNQLNKKHNLCLPDLQHFIFLEFLVTEKKQISPSPKKNIMSPPLKTSNPGWKTLGVSQFPAPSWIAIKRVVFVMPELLPRASADPGTSTTPWSRSRRLGWEDRLVGAGNISVEFELKSNEIIE